MSDVTQEGSSQVRNNPKSKEDKENKDMQNKDKKDKSSSGCGC